MYDEKIPLIAAADYSSSGQYHAMAVTGLMAASGVTGVGILQNKPKSGEDASVTYAGRSRFYAGAAVAAGAQLTITASGWLITATSGTNVVGKALAAVTSGSVGDGIFNFANGLIIA